MRIEEIDEKLEALKNRAIEKTGVEAAVASEIGLAAAPDPAMGDLGFPCFALARHLRKAPPVIAEEVAEHLRAELEEGGLVEEVITAGPYVNLRLNAGRLATDVVGQILDDGTTFGAGAGDGEHWMVEFSAPNTNKPQHLGHVRNNLLGDSVSRILERAGREVTRVNLINDRGIHICKSMLAYQRFGEGETPEEAGEKGDHFVGRYYVLFNTKFVEEYEAWLGTEEATVRYEEWLAGGREGSREEFRKEYQDKYFNRESELGQAARAMLRAWEEGDGAVVELWERMNRWVIDGFEATYDRLGVSFDRVYLESQTYQLGKEIVEGGLADGVFRRLDDGAIVCDLEKVGLEGEKVLLRGDGTSVYMTQDLGTATTRFDEYEMDRMVYVVGDEQQYHFDVLFRILGLLRPELKGRCIHLAYGMVELPEGKMKSREGTVVDADELLDEMEALAREALEERYDDLEEAEVAHRARVIGLAALKYFVLDFAPRTTVHFDPKKSIDFQGRTGPYCLYGYARINSISQKVGGWPEVGGASREEALGALGTELEMALVNHLKGWPETVRVAAQNQSPSRITEYLFHLAKAFSTLYNDGDHRIVELEGPRRAGLLLLAKATQIALGSGLSLLGIEVLEEM